MSERPDRDQQTEAPTPKRRREAARDGDVLQSRELATALVMVAGAAWLAFAGGWFFSSSANVVRTGLAIERSDLASFDPLARLLAPLVDSVAPLAALFAATLLAGVAGPALLGALGFRSSAIAFKASRLSPAAGLARMFGRAGWVELGKAWIKVLLVGAAGASFVWSSLDALRALTAVDAPRLAPVLGQQFVRLVGTLAAVLALIGLVDAPVQFLRRNARLRMSRQEVKEEAKESEASPEAKRALQTRRHEILNGSARKAVIEANVVLTNPTHFAVALRYRPGRDAAPQVVARGRGETALAIKALARENSVPQLEYPQLTRAIYFTARAGQPIPHDLYLAVATVLAFVFNLDRALAEGLRQPPVDVPPTKRFDERGRPSA